MTMHYHGTPITPRSALSQLGGCNFCVSYAHPADVEYVHRIGQSVMLDNGAFTFWKQGTPTSWPGFVAWAERWLQYPTTWAVIPDVIDGSEEDNDLLLAWLFNHNRDVYRRSAPVWHMHESLDRLRRLVAGYERVCVGSSGKYAVLGTSAWHHRMTEAFNAVAKEGTPWLHMLRGMNLVKPEFPYPFASVDSTDVARNHNRPQNTVVRMARRWDAMQCPAEWRVVDQLSMEVA